MIQITTRQLVEAVTTTTYYPEPAELYFYYSGTHAGFDPKNPYSRKRSGVTRTIYKPVEDKS